MILRLSAAAFLVFASLPSCPTTAGATPNAILTWQLGQADCSTPRSDGWLEDGIGSLLNVAVTDLAETYRAYAATIEIVPQDGAGFPDAWRFDASGCQAGAWSGVRLEPSPPETGCGSLIYGVGATAQSSGVTRTWDPATGRLRLDLTVALDGPYALAFPAAPRLVFRIPFDHAHSVLTIDAAEGNCGGRERAMCFWLRSLRFQGVDGTWFESARPAPVVAVNAPSLGGVSACAAVPVRGATWGGIKAQYR